MEVNSNDCVQEEAKLPKVEAKDVVAGEFQRRIKAARKKKNPCACLWCIVHTDTDTLTVDNGSELQIQVTEEDIKPAILSPLKASSPMLQDSGSQELDVLKEDSDSSCPVEVPAADAPELARNDAPAVLDLGDNDYQEPGPSRKRLKIEGEGGKSEREVKTDVKKKETRVYYPSIQLPAKKTGTAAGKPRYLCQWTALVYRTLKSHPNLVSRLQKQKIPVVGINGQRGLKEAIQTAMKEEGFVTGKFAPRDTFYLPVRGKEYALFCLYCETMFAKRHAAYHHDPNPRQPVHRDGRVFNCSNQHAKAKDCLKDETKCPLHEDGHIVDGVCCKDHGALKDFSYACSTC